VVDRSSGADRPFATFVLSAAAPAQFPKPDVKEVAFIGRSNVGKSSLLNALVGAKVAFVSGTPGRTRMVSFFDVRIGSGKGPVELRLADLPGYGFAKVSREAARDWPKFVEPYLAEREGLALCVVLALSVWLLIVLMKFLKAVVARLRTWFGGDPVPQAR